MDLKRSSTASALAKPPRLMARIAWLAAACFGGGLVSIGTGLVARGASGQSAVVWLPPGIALAGLLVWGKRCWPGVLLGALLISAMMGSHEAPSAPFRVHALLTVSIAGAMTLQAVALSALVRRFVDSTLALDRARTVLGFLLCAAAASLISSTLGSFTLLAAGVRTLQDLPFDWPSWWVSETISAFLVTPVLLAWCAKPAHVWRPRRLQLTLPLGLTLVLVAVAYAGANRLETERARASFDLKVDHLATSLNRELSTVEEGASTLRDLLEVDDSLSAAQFHTFVAELRSRKPAITGASWIPIVLAAERSRYEAEQHRTGQLDYEIRDIGRDGRMHRAPERPEYLPVQFVAPAATPIVGLDEAELTGRRELLDAARRTHGLAMSAPLELVGLARDRLGMLLAAPVCGAAPSCDAVRGFVVLAVQTGPLLQSLVAQLPGPALDVRLEDPSGVLGKRLLLANTDVHVPEARLPYRSERAIHLGGRTWLLSAMPSAAYLHATRSWLAPAVSGVGFVFAGLLCGFLLVTTGSSANVRRLVTERTHQLSQANDQLVDALATRERTGLALEESEARLHFAVEEAGQGFWDLNLQSNALYWSPKMFELLGYAESELEPTLERWKRLVHPDDLAPATALFRRHLSGATPFYVAEYRIRSKDGKYLWRLAQAKVLARDARGKPLRVIGTTLDISERKRSEQELEELVLARTAELQVAMAAAESANRAKSLFLANMSHELRTPMHAVLAFARLGLERDPEPKLQGFLSRIVESAQRLLLLLNDLLDLSKLDAGKMQMAFEPHDLQELVRELGAELEPLLASKQLALDCERTVDCESCVAPVDRARVAQLFRNVLANAVRFSTPGGRILVRFAPADPKCLPSRTKAAPEGALEIAISDEGIGIPENELELIFDSFVQSSKTDTNAGGTGLGLAICRQIAELHGGTVRAKNRHGVGATFIVTLPGERRAASDARNVA